MSLRDRAVAGVRWSVLSHGAKHAIQLVSTIVLVRLLSPSDFGLMAMVTVFAGLASLFRDLGTGEALIQRPELSDRLLSSVHWLSVACGLGACGVLTGAAPIIARFYDQPRTAPLLAVLSLTFVVAGLSVVHHALLRRKLAFRVLARVEVAAALGGAVAGVTAAVMGAGVWSLVYQALAVTTTTTLLLWLTYRWRPRLMFSWADLGSVTGFSLNLTGFNVFNHFVRNADSLIIGRVLGATELGYYTLAYQLMLYPLRNISAVMGRVMYPVYARLQDEDARFRTAFLKVSALIAAVTFPMMIGLMLVSRSFVETVVGPQWTPAVPILLILAPVGLVQSLLMNVGAIYQAKGRTGLLFLWSVGLGLFAVTAFLLGVRFGVLGVAVAYLFVTIVGAYPCLRIPLGLIGLSVGTFLTALWRPMACSLLMSAAVVLTMLLTTSRLPVAPALAVAVSSGLVTYAAATWLLNREQARETIGLAMLRTG